MSESENTEIIGARELGENAPRYVAMAKEGKRVPVGEHGEVVAYLVPAEERQPTTFQRMVAAGQVQMATGSIFDHLDPLPSGPGDKPLSLTLQEMRDEERW